MPRSALRMLLPMAGGIILGPRDVPRHARLFVPSGYEARGPGLVGRCRVLIDAKSKTMCGASFYRGEEAAWEKHVGECARRHIDAIREAAPSHARKGTVFDPEKWDPEVQAHMRRVGRRMEADGDFEVKPHERAGLS